MSVIQIDPRAVSTLKAMHEYAWPEWVENAEARRLDYIESQRLAGRTGGGPPCPWCGERSLRTLGEERRSGEPLRMQCGNPKCGRGASLRVEADGLAVRRYAMPRGHVRAA